ncbi:Yip1 family protein [Clostridium drakei]|uniref:YIP1 family protein n=1 Tax=Clostridium drakei TaxID=332101 RepID=A0A2U8DTV3_9CLOT|nr:Yip1 family protein [Clostridium drakei]AWI05502.1 YIP1 family protein [Clostridium drakei]
MSKESKDGILKTLIGVVISPKETMEKVNENPKVWRYLIPITIIQLIATIVELPKLISYTISQTQEMTNVSQAALPMIKIGVVISGIIGALIMPALAALISSALIKLIASITKENGSFKNLYCINLLAYVPVLIGLILAAIIMIFTEPQNVKNVSTSFTLFLSSSVDTKSGIYKLFSSIDFFYIWSSILAVIGTSVVFKMKIKKAAIIVFVIYIVSVIVKFSMLLRV